MKKDISFKDTQDFYVFTNMFVRTKRELLVGRYPLDDLYKQFGNKENIANIFKGCFREINKKGKLMDEHNMSSVTLSLSEDEIKMCKLFINNVLEDLKSQKEEDMSSIPEILEQTLSGRDLIIEREIEDFQKLNKIIL